ncbi:unnamed protein product [Prunus armeniaca]|uniref:Uncharacterized protein n=1 Tax=Prunus armeniaca TaxID=36596 RepID=A0A6J5XNC9_PRUAR|nr:unnamed protein product [Prunus armeniaca]
MEPQATQNSPPTAQNTTHSLHTPAHTPYFVVNFIDGRDFSDMDDLNGKTVVSRKVAKAMSWLPQNPEVMENPALNTGKYLFPEMDHYLDLDYGSVERERDLRGPATRSEHSPTLKSLTYRTCHGLPPIVSAASRP